MTTLAVIVATYRRAVQLKSCLNALSRQSHPPNQIIVVVRPDDEAAIDICTAHPAPRPEIVPVARTGVAAAYNAGLATASADIVAFTDDDAEPDPDWVALLLAGYERYPDVAGIGGRDILNTDATPATPAPTVGRMQWFGRAIGNHHIGRGPARRVDILKGVNMSFRTARIRGLWFDEALRGSGAQVGVELGFCLALRRRGGTLLYDPAITVRHDPGPRGDADPRDRFVAAAFTDSVANVTYLTLLHLPPVQRIVFTVYGTLIGTRGEPGVAQLIRLWLKTDRAAVGKFIAAWRGRRAGWRRFREDDDNRGALLISRRPRGRGVPPAA